MMYLTARQSIIGVTQTNSKTSTFKIHYLTQLNPRSFFCWIASKLKWGFEIITEHNVERRILVHYHLVDYLGKTINGVLYRRWIHIDYRLISEKSPKTALGKYYKELGRVHQCVRWPAFPGRKLSPELQDPTEQLQQVHEALCWLQLLRCTVPGFQGHTQGSFPYRHSCTLWSEGYNHRLALSDSTGDWLGLGLASNVLQHIFMYWHANV